MSQRSAGTSVADLAEQFKSNRVDSWAVVSAEGEYIHRQGAFLENVNLINGVFHALQCTVGVLRQGEKFVKVTFTFDTVAYVATVLPNFTSTATNCKQCVVIARR